ncbi:exported hypothetical protein [Rubrivivax sp. A210]|uniref:hypothetical protein n=1 Tax=Rubrivivax sp. A210 TaxID=2772301 RepID=UPI00191A8573|nr:hypothetical protein [Rubrivivax sp. A210]CAD5369828.1 exported hypothetical protein [Rubrivivax sp. A210]
MKVSNKIAIAALSAALVSGSAIAAQDDSFAALQGVDSTELSAVEMDAVTGQLTVAELTAFINKMPASPLKTYLQRLISNPKNAKLVNFIVASLTKIGF